MEMLGTYELTGHLSSQNSGYSIWGFGKRGGRDYFIKQFLSPKYPEGDTVSSPERLQKKIAQCRKFEQMKFAIYQQLNANTDGNAVRVTEFFRIGSKYYITMPKIEALPWGAEDVAALPEADKRRLCSIIAHGIAGIHKGRIVHADLKHDNVLFMYARNGSVTAKIIDFDSSFLETDPPEAGEDIIGDLVYFSPEACMSIWGEPRELTCKMDIFSLGVLFHQYFAGELPGFDREQCNYPGEAVAKGFPLTLSEKIPEDVKELLSKMLAEDPAQRPDAQTVFRGLFNGAPPEEVAEETVVSAPVAEPPRSEAFSSSTTSGNPFFAAGDL